MKCIFHLLFFSSTIHAFDLEKPIDFINREKFVAYLNNLEKQFDTAPSFLLRKEKIGYYILGLLTIVEILSFSAPKELKNKIEVYFKESKKKALLEQHLSLLRRLLTKDFLYLIIPQKTIGKDIGLKALLKENPEQQKFFNYYLTYCLEFSALRLFDTIPPKEKEKPGVVSLYELSRSNFILQVAHLVARVYDLYLSLPVSILQQLENAQAPFYENHLLLVSKQFLDTLIQDYQKNFNRELLPLGHSKKEHVRRHSYRELLQTLIGQERPLKVSTVEQLSHDLLFLNSSL